MQLKSIGVSIAFVFLFHTVEKLVMERCPVFASLHFRFLLLLLSFMDEIFLFQTNFRFNRKNFHISQEYTYFSVYNQIHSMDTTLSIDC